MAIRLKTPPLCAYHVVWCLKYRRRVIGGRTEARLKARAVSGQRRPGEVRAFAGHPVEGVAPLRVGAEVCGPL